MRHHISEAVTQVVICLFSHTCEYENSTICIKFLFMETHKYYLSTFILYCFIFSVANFVRSACLPSGRTSVKGIND